MTDFTMPSLGADMDEGTLLEWLVAPGDVVHKGDILAVVDTAKSAVDVESFSDGIVGALLVEPGTVVPVGTVLATLDGAPAQAAPAHAAPAQAAPAPAPAPAPTPAPAPAPAPPIGSPLVRREAADLGVDLADVVGTGRGGAIRRIDVERTAAERVAAVRARDARPRITPYARRLAGELGVDIATVTAPGDRPVRAGDVRAAAAAQAPTPAREPRRTTPRKTTPRKTAPREPAPREPVAPATAPAAADKQQAMRHAIAALMTRAKREIPHYYLSTTVDLDRALRWMHERNRGLPVTERLVPAALLLKATALATARAPQLNGFWVDDGFVPGEGVHLGVATSLRGGGLVAPALHDADTLPLGELMVRMRDLVTRARAGRMHRAEMSDPTITVTNLGEQGVESVQGVIYPPQVALVGFGRISDRPWAVDGLLGVRPLVTLTLAADHRATDGFTGGRFLADLDQQLQHPEDL